ncbi:MAG: lipid A-modifier LpxR family protein, partial [Planctomycetota bacterium]
PSSARTRGRVSHSKSPELGNVFTNLQSGIDLRFGRNLPRDRGPWRAAESPFALYGVVGGNFRLALHDITLDDSLFGNNDPAIVLDRDPAVWQWNFQLVAEWEGFTLGYRFLRQTKEYEEEVGLHDQGTIWLGYRYVF